MFLTPADTEKLLLSVAGMVARDRHERGVLLNHPESIALLSCWVMERAREGKTVKYLMDHGVHVLRTEHVMDGVPEMIPDLQVEATFPDGRKLIPLSRPIRPAITVEPAAAEDAATEEPPATEKPASGPAGGRGGAMDEPPGALRVGDGDIELNAGRDKRKVFIRNDGDRPIQIGSHIHLADTNAALAFIAVDDPDGPPDRTLVDGFRLDIEAGKSLRFQPGDDKIVDVVALAGRRMVPGIRIRNVEVHGE